MRSPERDADLRAVLARAYGPATAAALVSAAHVTTASLSRRREFTRPGSRARTESIERMPKYVRARDAAEYASEVAALDAARPRTWGECEARALGTATSPCPFLRCVHHLAVDVSRRTGSIKATYPDRDLTDHPATCSLRVADRGERTLEEIGVFMNLTRERIRVIELRALAKLSAATDPAALEQPVGAAEPSDLYAPGDISFANRPRAVGP